MSGNEQPQSPPEFDFAGFVAAASQMKHMFDSFTKVGFTDDQAIKLIVGLAATPSRGEGASEPEPEQGGQS